MSDLQSMINTHKITSIPVYVGSFDGSPTRERDHDVYDVLLIIATDMNLYGGDENPQARTMLIKGYGQSWANSLPQQRGTLVPPTTAEVLESAISDAAYANYDSAQEWADDLQITRQVEEEWQGYVALRADLRTFLGDLYDEFTDSL